ncbi:MAG: hypothetical protein D3922_08750, partial [Candidatus Electrothrix sp. AR1]|nr:hypothetical protein [Candidatus Electrothrix sp. AR1]
MKKLFPIYTTSLLILSVVLSVVLSGCGEDADQRNASAPQQQKKVTQQQNESDPFETAANSSVWPPSAAKQENILPADQWTR